MDFRRLRDAGFALAVALCAISFHLQADEPPAFSKEKLAELQRLADDPQIERASAAWILDSQKAAQQHLRAVAANGDARSLLAASMLWSGFSGLHEGNALPSTRPAQETRVWFDAARRASPRDVLVAWIEASDCGNLTDSCNRQEALRYLLEAEPHNAAVQLLALAEAEKRGDRKAMDLYWKSASSASIYDPHTLEIGQLLHATMQGVDFPSLETRLAEAMGARWGLNRPAIPRDLADISVIGISAALALPGFTPVTRTCKTEQLATASVMRRAECERVLELLATDDSTVIAPMIALPRLVALSGETTEGRAWRERLRQFYWVYENALQRMPGVTPAGPVPVEYGSWFMTEGELTAMRKLIARYDVPAEAPTGWLPREPRYRALVTTGKELVGTQ